MYIKIRTEIDPKVVLSILTTLSESRILCSYLDKEPRLLSYDFAEKMKENPSKWSHFRWHLTYDGFTYIVTYKKIVLALQSMIEDYQSTYWNKHHNPLHVALGVDYGDYWFCLEVIEYVMFKNIIWA